MRHQNQLRQTLVPFEESLAGPSASFNVPQQIQPHTHPKPMSTQPAYVDATSTCAPSSGSSSPSTAWAQAPNMAAWLHRKLRCPQTYFSFYIIFFLFSFLFFSVIPPSHLYSRRIYSLYSDSKKKNLACSSWGENYSGNTDTYALSNSVCILPVIYVRLLRFYTCALLFRPPHTQYVKIPVE